MCAWHLLAVAATATLLAGCGADPDSVAPVMTKPVKPPASSPAGTASADPVTGTGSADSPRQVRCTGGEAHLDTRERPTADDLAVGPLRWPGLLSWATADPADHGNADSYKLGAEVEAGSVVTVTVS
ncbi:hypothetical protein ACNTMW_27920 [Planosporangium sp. 12N6]|uniref:hypothetical protein n=1 Tax=Planosporangium spinosum TaxID=3402278 RepID=UPI003CF31D9B